MRFIGKIFDSFRPHFEKGGRLRPFHPVFDATENFFFAPSAVTQSAPHISDPLDLKRYMFMVIIAILPCALASIYFFGLRMIPMILVSYAAGGAVEVFFAVVRKEEISEGFLVTGLIFPLILPPGIPLWMVAVGIIFGVLVGKELFGGTGRNLFNPALVGRCFLLLGYPIAATSNWFTPGSGLTGRALTYVSSSTADAVTAATPLMQGRLGEFAEIRNLFFGSVAGSAGETSALLIIAGGIFLLLTRVANWRTVAGILGSFLALGVLMNAVAPDHFGPVVWHLFAGGLLFGAFFMATDPVTSPSTNGGKWVYGIIIGVSTLLIRNLTGFVEGMMFAILLGNIFSQVIDEVFIRRKIKGLAYEK